MCWCGTNEWVKVMYVRGGCEESFEWQIGGYMFHTLHTLKSVLAFILNTHQTVYSL